MRADSPMPHAEADFDLFKDADANEASRIVELAVKAEHPFEEEVSAADYNPDEDRKLDDRRHAERNAQPVKEEVQPQVDLTMANDDDDDDDDADDMFSLGHKPVALGTSATATFVPVRSSSTSSFPALTAAERRSSTALSTKLAAASRTTLTTQKGTTSSCSASSLTTVAITSMQT